MLLRLRSFTGLSSAALSLLAVVAAGCSGGDEGEPFGTAQEEIVVCPGPSVVQGIDVSVYQGNIDWAAVKGSRIGFAITRIGDGLLKDSKFDQNWPAIKAAGLIRGAYQFFEPDDDPAAQADIVIQKVGVLGPGICPASSTSRPQGAIGGDHRRQHPYLVRQGQSGYGQDALHLHGQVLLARQRRQQRGFRRYPALARRLRLPCPNTLFRGRPGRCGNTRPPARSPDLRQRRSRSVQWHASKISRPSPASIRTGRPSMSLSRSSGGGPSGDDGQPEHPGVHRAPERGQEGLGREHLPRDDAAARSSERVRRAGLAELEQAFGGGRRGEAGRQLQIPVHAPRSQQAGDVLRVLQRRSGGRALVRRSRAGRPAGRAAPGADPGDRGRVPGRARHAIVPGPRRGADRARVGREPRWLDRSQERGHGHVEGGETQLAPTPRDQSSPLADASWISPKRVSTLAADVPPGEVGHSR